jgi:hypothetical protein
MEDLEVALGRPTSAELARRIGCSENDVRKWRERGLPDLTADRFACRAGLHPACVWMEWTEHLPEPPTTALILEAVDRGPKNLDSLVAITGCPRPRLRHAAYRLKAAGMVTIDKRKRIVLAGPR